MSWFETGRQRELRLTRQAWNEVEQAWKHTLVGQHGLLGFALGLVGHFADLVGDALPKRLIAALIDATQELLELEEIGPIDPVWPVIEQEVSGAVAFRALTVRRRRWALDFNNQQQALQKWVLGGWKRLVESIPPLPTGTDEALFEAPLIEVIEKPAHVIETLIVNAFTDEADRRDLFKRLRGQFEHNLLRASGLPPNGPWPTNAARIVMPTAQKGRTPAELAELYLAGTPYAKLLDTPIPFAIPQEARFEHGHIVGGTGHGKTQLMQRMIHADLVAAQTGRRSVVVIDSQGDLINKLVRLGLFAPEIEDSLADRLVLIDPADVEFPASLNLFDAHLSRLDAYRPVDRERVLNGVVELYEVFFGDLLGAELTQRQGVIFKYLARLMLTIPDATIHTLMQLMEDAKPFRGYMDQLDGSARYFFATEFFHPSFAATKRQILKRLWGVLSTPAFERMFAQTANKLDLFQAMQDGKIILVNTAKDLLKSEGSQLFGRFFVALLAQAALERSTLYEDERTPTFVYVDEAQEYFDDRIETILTQARKYRVGITLAHQTLDQLSPRLRSSIHANTSLKCAGGVSARDARGLAEELHTTPDFIEGMRRRTGHTEFALWLKRSTPSAMRLSVPLGFLEGQPIQTEEAFAALIDANRRRYCGTLAEVAQLTPNALVPEPVEAERSVVAPPSSPPSEEAERPVRPPLPQRTEPARERPAPRTPPVPGKGGPQHKYLQHLIKQLAEERGLRAVIEQPVEGGQVDVGLYQGELAIACEISISSTPSYEAQNLTKCLRAGFARVWAIAPDAKRRNAVEQAASELLGADTAKIEFLTTDEMIETLDALVVPVPEEQVVKGYRVKTTRKAISPAEAKERRAAIARILSQASRMQQR